MVDLISYPFRLTENGSAVVTTDGEDYYAQELACLIMTEPGERPLVPEYGIEDPTFAGWNIYELEQKINFFGPPVEIDNPTAIFVRDGLLNVTFEFTAVDLEVEDDDDSDDGYNDDLLEYENDTYGYNESTDV